MLSLHQGDIVFAYFPYEEDKTIVKKRPCLVLAVQNEKHRFLAAKITITPLPQSWAIHLQAGNINLALGNLRAESWINLNRREWLPFQNYIFTIGTVKRNILDTIIKHITS